MKVDWDVALMFGVLYALPVVAGTAVDILEYYKTQTGKSVGSLYIQLKVCAGVISYG